MGEKAEYVRRRGFDRPQMEQMILEYVRSYGHIARRDVMDLCRVNRQQAIYLLRQMVKAGHLERWGSGRNIVYRLKG
ncbi:MAG: hypothetical protein ACK4WK_03550 [Anaerolineae bacterium]